MILIIIMIHFRSKIINVTEAIALTKVNVYSGKKKKTLSRNATLIKKSVSKIWMLAVEKHLQVDYDICQEK